MRINDGDAVRNAACAGLGIALMATWCASDELRSGTLVPALPEHPLVSTQTLWALYPSSRELAPKVRVFIDWLTGRFGQQPYWDRGLEEMIGLGKEAIYLIVPSAGWSPEPSIRAGRHTSAMALFVIVLLPRHVRSRARPAALA